MTTKQYLAALKKLGLSPYGAPVARLLGISLRQSQRLAGGHQKVTKTIELLLGMYMLHGLPVLRIFKVRGGADYTISPADEDAAEA